MLNVTTVDDFVNTNYQNKLENIILNLGSFPWFYGHSTCDLTLKDVVKFNERTKESAQFTHTFYAGGKVMSSHYPLVENFLPIMEERFGRNFKDSIIRIKANLILNDSTYPVGFYNSPHVDEASNVETALYYVNDSDGDTVIFNEQVGENQLNEFSRVSPVKGKLAIFNSSYFHASTPPIKSKHRAVINFVFRR